MDRKLNDKIKILMKISNKSNEDMAKCLGIGYQSFTNKINQKSFNDIDLLKVAKETGTRLAFVDDEGVPVIIFENSDIK